jgi:hypothetical protein
VNNEPGKDLERIDLDLIADLLRHLPGGSADMAKTPMSGQPVFR